MVCERFSHETNRGRGSTQRDTFELARPEYLCEWMLSKLALRNDEQRSSARVEGEVAYSLLREEGTLGESLHNARVVFLGNYENNSSVDLRGNIHG